MCSHYEAPSRQALWEAYGIAPEETWVTDLWPGYVGPFVRPALETDPHDKAAPTLEALVGTFGLLPAWAKDHKLARRTYNALGALLTVIYR